MSKLLQDAVSEFAKLPGVGRRTALRLAMHLLKMDSQEVEQMMRPSTAIVSRFAIASDATISRIQIFVRYVVIQNETTLQSA